MGRYIGQIQDEVHGVLIPGDLWRDEIRRSVVALTEAGPGVGIVYAWAKRFGNSEGLWTPESFGLICLLHHNLMVASAMFSGVGWAEVGGEMRPRYEDWVF